MQKISIIILVLFNIAFASADLNTSFENKVYSDKEIKILLNNWKKVLKIFEAMNPPANTNYTYYVKSTICLDNGDLSEDLKTTFSNSFMLKKFSDKNHFATSFKNDHKRFILFLNPLDKETLVLMNNLDLLRGKNVIIVFLADGQYDYDFIAKIFFDELDSIFVEKVNFYKYIYLKNQVFFEKLRKSKFQYFEKNKELQGILDEFDYNHRKANEFYGRETWYSKPIGAKMYKNRNLEADKQNFNWDAQKIEKDMKIKITPYINFF